MVFLLLVVGLIALGVWTGAAVWYVFAGVLAGIWMLFLLLALAGARAVIKRVNQDFKKFDERRELGSGGRSPFDSDFFKNSRRRW